MRSYRLRGPLQLLGFRLLRDLGPGWPCFGVVYVAAAVSGLDSLPRRSGKLCTVCAGIHWQSVTHRLFEDFRGERVVCVSASER